MYKSIRRNLKNIEGKSTSITYIDSIGILLYLFLSMKDEYSRILNGFLVIYALGYMLSIIHSIVSYYGELIMEENNILNMIVLSREEIVDLYIKNLMFKTIYISILFGIILSRNSYFLDFESILYGAIFIEIILLTVINFMFTSINIVQSRLRPRISIFTIKFKNILSLVLGLVFMGILYLSFLMASLRPIIYNLQARSIIRAEDMISLKYDYIKQTVFLNINKEVYVNVVFIVILILLNLALILLRNYLKRRSRYEIAS